MRCTKKWMIAIVWLKVFLFTSCAPTKTIHSPARSSTLTGSGFYKIAAGYNWQQRDSLAVSEILKGNIPNLLKKFVPVNVQTFDSAKNHYIHATFFVARDYLSVGNDNDWARINISPMAAQKIADSLDCFLPTKKMVNDIYQAATEKLEPIPMYAYRDSSPTMYQHHLIIEGQRKKQKASRHATQGLIAGIKKDIVISDKLVHNSKPGHVAIYGWHLLNGKPIQPLYTGHINSWVDYSQGTRLVYQLIKLGRNWMNYKDVLKDPVLRRLLCDEESCDFYKYDY
ncbi:MAG: hypothetical protein ABIY51_02820 [Ferruginibacter sp.]